MEMQQQNGMVLACTVENCAWWKNRQCHAPKIEVGSTHPMCDTFTEQMQVDQADIDEPRVAMCSVQECKFNDQGQECSAPGITVGHHADHADCDTYVPMA